MGLKECNIVLDNPWNTYYAGQAVHGRADFILDSPKKIRGIVVRFLGEAKTAWHISQISWDNEGESYDNVIYLSGHEEYFHIQNYLLGDANNSDAIELPSGKHTFPFTCALPSNIPSSFEGEFGHVRYTIKVTLDRPWKFDQDLKMAFTVLCPVDLNLNPQIKEPFKLELSDTYCCFCCQSGPISLVVTLPVIGYVSGQKIPLTIDCDNCSNVDVTNISIVLRKLVVFYSEIPRRQFRQVKIKIARLNLECDEKTKIGFWQEKIDIPPLPPSNLSHCSIINLDYDVKVTAEVSGVHSNLEGTIPIILGTIPLVSFQQSAQHTDTVSPERSENDGGGAVGWSDADKGNHLYPNMDPPTFLAVDYRAAIKDKNDTEFTRFIGGVDYAPRYPTVNYRLTTPNR